MIAQKRAVILSLVLVAVFWVFPAPTFADQAPQEDLQYQTGSGGFCRLDGYGVSSDLDRPEKPDIHWFKDQLKISPKYQERRQGIAGMTWLQFLTMTFLAIFCMAATVAFVVWNRRTKLILASLLEEDKHGTKS